MFNHFQGLSLTTTNSRRNHFFKTYSSYQYRKFFPSVSEIREDVAFPPLPSEEVQFDATGDGLKKNG